MRRALAFACAGILSLAQLSAGNVDEVPAGSPVAAPSSGEAPAEAGRAGADFGGEAAEPGGVLEDFVVTAYRFDGEPLETPANSTYISREKIEGSAYTNVADVISRFGNVNFRSVVGSSASGDLAMRGFGENSQTRVLVMVDGLRFNRSDMGAINWLQIPLSDVESVEVLRGPQSALYGSSAEAGVIKITTIGAKEDGVNFSSQALYGQYGTYNLAARASGRDGANFFAAAVNYFSSDGWRKNSENRAASANLTLGCDINPDNTVALSGNFTDSSINYPGPLTWAQYQEDPLQSDGKGSTSRSKDGIVRASLKSKSAAGEGEVEAGANFRDIHWNMGGRSKNFQWTGTFSPRYKFEVSDNAKLLAGFDGAYDSIDFNLYYKQTQFSKGLADVSRISAAPYLGGEWSPFEGLLLSAVVRYEGMRISAENTEYIDASIEPTRVITMGGVQYVVPNPNYPPKVNSATSFDSSKWFNGVGGNFAVNWRVRSDLSMFFKFDQIYHYPATDEIASYQGGGLPIPFNFNLKPETGQNYEIGAKFFSGPWTFTGSVFVTDLRDEIGYYEYVDSSGTSYWLNTNMPPTLRYGADIEARYDAKYWGVGAMLAVVRAQFDGGEFDGNEVPLVPNFYGNVSAYIRPLSWVTLSARVNFLSEQYAGSDYANQYRKIPAYALVDFQLTFGICRYATLFFAIENALDKRYVSCAWSSGYYPGMGRMMKAGVNINF